MYKNYFKRIVDLIIGIPALIVLSPLFVITAIFIKLEDPTGPVMFKQERVGINMEPFIIYKFRTMAVNTPQITTNELQGLESYVTKTGAFLRKTSIDELPQLINIIKGEMSIVGPRPSIDSEVRLNTQRQRFGVYDCKPGLTGLAQIRGRDNILMKDKVSYDGIYARNISFGLDMYCIFNTFYVVVTGKGVNEGDKEKKERTKLIERTDRQN